MPLTGAHPAETRATALRLLRETDLSIVAIAGRLYGVLRNAGVRGV